MIKLRQLISHLLLERMTYNQLMKSTTPGRIDRGGRIPAKSLIVTTKNDKEAWKFSYKSPKTEITTGKRHQGFIYFFKDNIEQDDDTMSIDCSVDCSCPDYRYRLSYANKQQDAGENGSDSLNKGLNYPSSINVGPGLCKHLVSLKEFLRTKFETDTTKPSTPEKPAPLVAVPSTPPPDKKVPEDPDQEQEPQIDPTQTPEPVPVSDVPQEEPIVDDPTQTPEEPTDVNPEEPVEPNPEEDPNNKDKIKESVIDKKKVVGVLNALCVENKTFVI